MTDAVLKGTVRVNGKLVSIPFKRGQVFEDVCEELLVIRAVHKRGNDAKIEYVHEDGYIGSFYASHPPDLTLFISTDKVKKQSTHKQVLDTLKEVS